MVLFSGSFEILILNQNSEAVKQEQGAERLSDDLAFIVRWCKKDEGLQLMIISILD